MRKFGEAVTLLALGLGLAVGLAAPAGAFTGQPAPAISLHALDGKPLKSPAARDKRAELVVFWASW